MRPFKGKGPVYKLDRSRKARMIDAILRAHLGRPVAGMRMLDIGCGNGDIAMFFAAANAVVGVDIAERLKPHERQFAFHLVDSERLPFADHSFDVVLSHHVIEHVDDQRLHLAEMARVLRRGGFAYLATPNRSSPIMQGHVGNDMVLRYPQMEPLFKAAGFEVIEYSIPLLKEPARYFSDFPGYRLVPVALLKLLRPLFPSHVFVLPLRDA